MRTVVITGLGASTPLGGDLPTTWSALLAGTSGVSLIEADWAQELSTRIAAQAAVDPASMMDRVAARKLDRSSQFAMVAALEAWADAGLGLDDESTVDPDRLLVSLGTGIGGLHSLLGNWD
ncbi:MAG TPA: beta-ketoacyl synthase N-terminal-like domain-containing protein, partial [Propionibacteriaceae bacterium]